jgi:3-deoxy-D-manno-octulosonic-acid transferase
MRLQVARISYSLLIYLAMLPTLLLLLWRSLKDKRYRWRIQERFALQQVPEQAMGGLVIHAVSVGEIVAATPLIKALQQQYPELRLTVSCTTPTGAERITKNFGDTVYQCYLPFDTPGAVGRWLNKLQPQAVVILETELWPNLLQRCSDALIPTIVVNARLSKRSARGYRRFFCFSQLALKNISVLLAQNNATARRFHALGCTAKSQVCGNLKFDMVVPDTVATIVTSYQAQFSGRQVWVAGSTHDGEEELLFAAYKQLKPEFPQLLLVVVPRHPERFDTVAKLAQSQEMSVKRRSQNGQVSTDTEVFLADSMGELLAWYNLADIVFVGGSLIARGGHNPLEAMLFGKPIQSGSHIFNFAQAFQWLEKAGAINWVHNVSSLVTNTTKLLSQTEFAKRQGQQAKLVYQQHGGAAARMCQYIASYLGAEVRQLSVQKCKSEIIWFDRELFGQPDELSFEPAHWRQRQAIIGQSQGRNTAWFIRHQSTNFVLRHYYRGGLIGKMVQDSFTLEPPLNSRALQEFALLRHMRRCDLPVPKPLAARYVRHRMSYQCDLIIELIANSKDVATLLSQGASLSELQWQQLGRLIARFHQHGVFHSDLNCHNILLDAKGQFWLIDFDKCSIKAPGAWQHANLQRLLRSLEKERNKQPQFNWHSAQWPALLQGYQQQFNDKKL